MLNRRLNTLSLKKYNNKNRIVVWFFLILLSLSTACSEKVRTRVLSFVFDGVPDKSQIDSSNTSIVSVPDTLKKISKTVVVKPDLPDVFYHDPYEEKQCSKCHDPSSPGKMSYAQDLVCFTCHTDFKTEYKYIHGPVAGGFCTSCHAPHLSKNKKLLVRTGQDLCLNCHTKDLILQNEMHADIGSSDCTECHNPHGGSDKFILN